MIQPVGSIGALCTLGYAPPILYIRSLLHRAGAVRNFRGACTGEVRRISLLRTRMNKLQISFSS